uniref:Diuretic hormone n=1 Tax=Cacopsylla melanoneura TaxID=428564 RepID=A0A8D8LXA2_9HEMI
MSLVSRVVPLFVLLSLSPSSIRSSEIIKTLQELNPGPADSETARFLLPKLAEKYSKYVTDLSGARGGGGEGGTEDAGAWDEYVYDPKLFLLTETEEEGPSANNYVDYRDKREAKMFREGGGGMGGNNNLIRGSTWNKGPSLSIVNPLDVLRQRLMLEIARRRQEKSQNQIDKNREILSNLGKRSYYQPSSQSRQERRSGDGGEWELMNWQSFMAEPMSSSLSRRSSRSQAEFPHSETHHDLEHRNYNRHVN